MFNIGWDMVFALAHHSFADKPANWNPDPRVNEGSHDDHRTGASMSILTI
jgi:hypothetical protein